MKLATLKAGGRDGTLVVVSRDLSTAVTAGEISPTLQLVLDNWDALAPRLEEVYARLNDGRMNDTFDLDMEDLAAPLPRAYQWLDGSAYLPHVERVRKARGAEMPPSFQHDPLMYQGARTRSSARATPCWSPMRPSALISSPR
jgi:fumarylacetoacetate (FAA) hydrolase